MAFGVTDPLGPHSPYASGPWTAPPGDAIARRRLGVAAINRDGVSIEIAGFDADPVADVAFERLARLVAYWADWCGIPHGGWPVNPETGLTFVYWHSEFNGAKSCPGVVVRKLTAPLIRRAGELLRSAQAAPSGGDPEPIPSPPRPPVDLDLPSGVTVQDLVDWFGSAPAPDGSGRRFTFDPAGPLSRAWRKRPDDRRLAGAGDGRAGRRRRDLPVRRRLDAPGAAGRDRRRGGRLTGTAPDELALIPRTRRSFHALDEGGTNMDTDITLTSIVIGSLLPNIIAIVVQPVWRKETRGLAAFGICAVAGVLIALLQGDIGRGGDVATSVVAVLITSQVLYQTLWRPSGIVPAIERASSPADTRVVPGP